METVTGLTTTELTAIAVLGPFLFAAALALAGGIDWLWWWLHSGPDSYEAPTSKDYSDRITKPYKPTKPTAVHDELVRR